MTGSGRRRASGRIARLVNFVTGVIVGASLVSLAVSATQLSLHDGLFWRRLGSGDKNAYVAGYADAMQTSLSKVDSLKVAAKLFHWKGANKILNRVERGLDLSLLPCGDLVSYLDQVYSNPRYGDLEMTMAIEVGTMRGTELKPSSDSASPADGNKLGIRHSCSDR